MKVSVVMPVTDAHKMALKKAAPSAEFTFGKDETALKEADVIIGNIAPQKVKTLTKLRFLQLNSAGANTYCEPGILPDGVALTNATGAYGIAISEHILATVLFLMKRLPTYYDQGKAHRWEDAGPVNTLCGSTVAVIGLAILAAISAALQKPWELTSLVSDGARPTLSQKRMKWELLLCWGISFPGLMWSSPVFLTRRLRRDCIRKPVSLK